MATNLELETEAIVNRFREEGILDIIEERLESAKIKKYIYIHLIKPCNDFCSNLSPDLKIRLAGLIAKETIMTNLRLNIVSNSFRFSVANWVKRGDDSLKTTIIAFISTDELLYTMIDQLCLVYTQCMADEVEELESKKTGNKIFHPDKNLIN